VLGMSRWFVVDTYKKFMLVHIGTIRCLIKYLCRERYKE
jgi:hypothetical protein